MSDPNADLMKLRLAVQNLSAAPQAQRRYIQLGFMRPAVANLDRIASDVDPLVDGGLLNQEQADLARQVRDAVNARLEADADFLKESVSSPREFLFSDALEDDEWEQLRQLARRAYTAIAGDVSLFISTMAR